MGIEWAHVGRLQAKDNAEVLALDALAFAEALAMHSRVLQATVCYCTSFVQWQNAQDWTGSLTDLHSMDKAKLEDVITRAFGVSERPGGQPLERAFPKLLRWPSMAPTSSDCKP